MEAISRGVAAVTPPGAALKDVYYQFDSVNLEPDAQEILMKNAAWLRANPKAPFVRRAPINAAVFDSQALARYGK